MEEKITNKCIELGLKPDEVQLRCVKNKWYINSKLKNEKIDELEKFIKTLKNEIR
jgi:hypothetical protein